MSKVPINQIPPKKDPPKKNPPGKPVKDNPKPDPVWQMDPRGDKDTAIESDKIRAHTGNPFNINKAGIDPKHLDKTIPLFADLKNDSKKNHRTDYQLFIEYKSQLQDLVNTNTISADYMFGLLAQLPESVKDSKTSDQDKYDGWLLDMHLADTEQSRQHFAKLIGNDYWRTGMKATIDSGIGVPMMSKTKRSRMMKRSKDSNRFGF